MLAFCISSDIDFKKNSFAAFIVKDSEGQLSNRSKLKTKIVYYIPMLSNLVKTPEHKAVVAFLASAGPIGRGLTLPPGTPKGVIAGLRKAYDKMNADPKFAKELKKRRLRLMASSGETIQKVVNKVLKETSPAVIKLARKIIGLKTL